MTAAERCGIYTAFNQPYWDRYGARFVAMSEALNPRPAQLIVVTEVEAEFPEWWTVVRFWDDRVWPAFDKALDYATTEWVMLCGVDEQFDSDFFVDLPLAGDVVNVSGRWGNGNACYGTPSQWMNLLDLGHNGMPGLQMIRLEVQRKYPQRLHKWRDWISWAELRWHGVQASFDTRQKFVWCYEPGQTSFEADRAAEMEILCFISDLKTGRVIPGPEWPALLKPEQ
jgi:hypothetical protein